MEACSPVTCFVKASDLSARATTLAIVVMILDEPYSHGHPDALSLVLYSPRRTDGPAANSA